jgi:Txe/YoeB family toxin of Txe-Axe toxin-antitoxin module
MNKIAFSPAAWEDYEYWENQDKQTLKRIKRKNCSER